MMWSPLLVVLWLLVCFPGTSSICLSPLSVGSGAVVLEPKDFQSGRILKRRFSSKFSKREWHETSTRESEEASRCLRPLGSLISRHRNLKHSLNNDSVCHRTAEKMCGPRMNSLEQSIAQIFLVPPPFPLRLPATHPSLTRGPLGLWSD